MLLTLESSVDSLDSDFRPLDFMKEIFKSTPNLNKDVGALSGYGPCGKRVGYGGPGICVLGHSHHNNPNAHARSTSYSVSHYCARRTVGCPITAENKGKLIPAKWNIYYILGRNYLIDLVIYFSV